MADGYCMDSAAYSPVSSRCGKQASGGMASSGCDSERGILIRRVIKRGNFTSLADLREKILAFIDYFNRTMAKPFKWTYTGRPLNV